MTQNENLRWQLWWSSKDGQGSFNCGSYDTLSDAQGAAREAALEILEQCADDEQREGILTGSMGIVPLVGTEGRDGEVVGEWIESPVTKVLSKHLLALWLPSKSSGRDGKKDHPIECSRFWVSGDPNTTMRVVGCDVRYCGITYGAIELYDPERDIIMTGDESLLQTFGLNLRLEHIPGDPFWRFLDVEPGSDEEIKATRIEETIISSMRSFLDNEKRAAPEAA